MKKRAVKDIQTASFLGDLDIDAKTRVVRSRESARREFKVTFERADLPRYAKTMAAFANAQGGMLIFGIRNKPRELVGCSLTMISRRGRIRHATTELVRSSASV